KPSSELSAKQLQLLDAQEQQKMRPYLNVTITANTFSDWDFIIRNTGEGIAHDLGFRAIEFPPEAHVNDSQFPISKLGPQDDTRVPAVISAPDVPILKVCLTW